MLKKKDTVGINFQMDKLTSSELEKAAKISGRTKRQEAAFRLRDHVTRFRSSAPEYQNE